MKKLLLLLIILLFSFPVFADKTYTITWDANSEPDISHYVVYWGNATRTYTKNSGNIGLVTTYALTLPDTVATFITVTTVDESGLESDYSNEVNTKKPNAPVIKFTIKVEVSSVK
jgi:hypothetical protein